jgi:type I restriction-modification system DNA methylase subunit
MGGAIWSEIFIKDSKKADGAIIINDIVKAVIELKGTNTTDLSKVEDQAFGYKNNQPECVYVITSNFEKLWFYIDNAIEHSEFNLFTLTEKEFEVLYLCLAYDNIKNGIPKKIKDESLSQEDQITRQLYNDYSLFKRELHQNLVALNPGIDALLLFKKSQKLIDRFLFLFFAEDRQLLPPNSVRLIVDDWKVLQERDVEIPLYARFKKYFEYLNTGFKGKRYDVFAYNGGLFKPDEILDIIRIDDELLCNHLVRLSDYDFASEVDVNILGHIFENSLNELDEIKARLEGQEIDKTKTKRKKEGVFYTPKYITKYIVENTVGKLCDEKKAELQINEEEYLSDKKRQRKATLALTERLSEYRNWLLQLTICDPACGSGAFLNQALDYLISEHRYIDELQAKLFGDALVLSDLDKSILENNLFGVDLNEESVEIAKLSLWLRTARPNRKLNDLNDNLKCGNSLIDDPEVAGTKAFNWQQEFPKVFEKGGFDVVIGNPPYVRVQQLEYQTIDYLKKKYEVALKRVDISLCFIELSRKLIKVFSGYACFITSNQFLTTEYGQSIREFLLTKYKICECVDFGDLPIFSDALTYVGIFLFQNRTPDSFNYFKVNKVEEAQQLNFGNPLIIDIKTLSDDNWILKGSKLKIVFEKIKRNSVDLGKIGNAWAGLFTGMDSVLMFDKDELNNLDIEPEMLLPVIRANNCSKYHCFAAEKFVIYPYKFENGKTLILTEDELKVSFPKTYSYLLSHKVELGGRKDSRKSFAGRKDWFTLTRFGQKNIFKQVKIVSPGEVKDHKFCIDYSGAGFSCARVFAITISTEKYNIKFILCLLNSNLLKSFLQSFSSLKNGGFYSYSSNILNRIPIPQISAESQQPFIEKANLMLAFKKELHKTIQKCQRTIKRKFEIEELPGKLQNWHELTYAEFIRELGKKKIRLSLAEESEWEDYFNQEREKTNELKRQIEATDKEIDQMVYALYGLTEEEIKIVEGS